MKHKLPEALVELRSHGSLDWLAALVRDPDRFKVPGETRGKLARFLEAIDDDLIGAIVEAQEDHGWHEELADHLRQQAEWLLELAKVMSHGQDE